MALKPIMYIGFTWHSETKFDRTKATSRINQFDVILKFWVTLAFLTFLALLLFCQCKSCAHLHRCKRVQACVQECNCVYACVSVQLDDGPGSLNTKTWMKVWKAPWSPLEAPSANADTLQGGGGRGAGEGRSKPERRGQEVDAKQKIQGASTVQGSIRVLCRISKRVSTVSKKGIKCGKSVVLWNAGYSRRKMGCNVALRRHAKPSGTKFLWWFTVDIKFKMISDAQWIPEFWASG